MNQYTVKPYLSRDAVKTISILAMTGNHIAHVFLPPGSLSYELWIGLGYMTAITMCYLLVEGYHSTSHLRSYAIRLLIAGLISQYPFHAFSQTHTLNILFTLLLCLGIVHTMNSPQHERNIVQLILFAASACCDWSFYLPLCAVYFEECFQGRRNLRSTCFSLVFIFFVIEAVSTLLTPQGKAFTVFSFASILLHMTGPVLFAVIILFFYDRNRKNKRTAFSRWFFYLYYPGHLCLLLALSGRWIL